MNMICSHVCRPKTPAAVRADLVESVEYGGTAIFVEKIGYLVHLLAHHRDTISVSLH